MKPVDIPANEAVLRFLRRQEGRPIIVEPIQAHPDPYMGLGSHPDIVQRLWDDLGARIPSALRLIVCRNPALVHRSSRVIFGITLGTQYALRLTPELVAEAVKAGAKTQNRWSNGEVTDLASELGPDWIFGAWLSQEVDWCKQSFALFDANN